MGSERCADCRWLREVRIYPTTKPEDAEEIAEHYQSCGWWEANQPATPNRTMPFSFRWPMRESDFWMTRLCASGDCEHDHNPCPTWRPR